MKEIDFNIFTCKKQELLAMTAMNIKQCFSPYHDSVFLLFCYSLCFLSLRRAELNTNNLNIWTTEKNQNRSTCKECKI